MATRFLGNTVSSSKSRGFIELIITVLVVLLGDSFSSFLVTFATSHLEAVLVISYLASFDKSRLLQKSIEDKLSKLKQEKDNIKEEIHHISPELHKVHF